MSSHGADFGNWVSWVVLNGETDQAVVPSTVSRVLAVTDTWPIAADHGPFAYALRRLGLSSD